MVGGHREVTRERAIALLEERDDPEHEVAVPRVQPGERLGGAPGVERRQVVHQVLNLALQTELRDWPDGGGVLQANRRVATSSAPLSLRAAPGRPSTRPSTNAARAAKQWGRGEQLGELVGRLF